MPNNVTFGGNRYISQDFYNIDYQNFRLGYQLIGSETAVELYGVASMTSTYNIEDVMILGVGVKGDTQFMANLNRSGIVEMGINRANQQLDDLHKLWKKRAKMHLIMYMQHGNIERLTCRNAIISFIEPLNMTDDASVLTVRWICPRLELDINSRGEPYGNRPNENAADNV